MTALVVCLCFGIGFVIGYLFRDTFYAGQNKSDEPHGKAKIGFVTYRERQLARVRYESDADRIRELNLLSQNESKFMRLLQHQFLEHTVIIKAGRFYITDQDNYPLAIFEYQDGSEPLKMSHTEDGLKVYLYKAMLSSEALAEDKRTVIGGRNGS